MKQGKNFVHASAIVHPSARIGIGVIIYPGVTVEADVNIGPYSVIGGHPEHRDFLHGEKSSGVILRSGARIFEFVTIHAGTRHPTVVGSRAAVFNHSHIGHDSVLEEDSIVGGQVSLAGHTVVMQNAIVSGKACTHQFCVVGAYSIVAAASFARLHVPPGEKWYGMPAARAAGLNTIGLERAGLTYEECIARFGPRYQSLISERKI